MDEIKKSIEEIKSDLKDVNTSLREIDKTLVKQEGQLAEHIRRTNLLEEKLEPIDTHVKMVNGALKLIGGIALLASIYRFLKP